MVDLLDNVVELKVNRVAKYKKKLKPRSSAIILGLGSIVTIVLMTFTIGKYWVEIFDKYQEKQELEEELTYLKEKFNII